jgi:hypothetical protein
VKYGPNTQAVERLLKQLEGITPAQIDDLEAIRDASWKATWDAGHAAARVVGQTADRHAAWEAAWDAAWDVGRDTAWGALRGARRGAGWDAVLALVVRDKISEEHFEALYGPWKRVMDK